MRRFFFLQNSPVDCFVKPKELTELGTGRSQFVRAGVRRVQPFVHGYRECNIPVQVKGGSLAQLSGVCDGFLCGDGTAFRLSCPHSGLGITSG